MTRDEILALSPGQVIDACVAEHVMGWTQADEYYGSLRFMDSRPDIVASIPPTDDLTPSKADWFNPSRSIEAAMVVLCEARKKLGTMYFLIQDDDTDDGYCCWIGNRSTAAEGATISEAICKAALLACWKD